jgi:hypothetical protein
VIGGILAGVIGKKAFEALWGVFDDEEAPDPQHRNITLKKLIPALLLEGRSFGWCAGCSTTALAGHSAS